MELTATCNHCGEAGIPSVEDMAEHFRRNHVVRVTPEELRAAGITERQEALAFNAATATVPYGEFVRLSTRQQMVRAALLAAAVRAARD